MPYFMLFNELRDSTAFRKTTKVIYHCFAVTARILRIAQWLFADATLAQAARVQCSGFRKFIREDTVILSAIPRPRTSNPAPLGIANHDVAITRLVGEI